MYIWGPRRRKMLKIKTAQISDFTDVDVRRVWGHAYNHLKTQNQEEAIPSLWELQGELLRSHPHISLPELLNTPSGEYLERILGSDHWVFNPNGGTFI